MRRHFIKTIAFGAAGVAVLGLPVPSALAQGADPALFVVSPKRHFRVTFTDPTARCQVSHVPLRMTIEPASPAIGQPDAEQALAQLLAGIFQHDPRCASAQSVSLTVVEPSGTTRQFEATREKNWQFVQALDSVKVTPSKGDGQAASPQRNNVAASSVPASQPLSNQTPPAVVPAPASIPPLNGKYALLALAARANPAWFNDETAQRCWAGFRYQREWFRADEFGKHGLMQRARDDLRQTAGAVAPDTIEVDVQSALGPYDFTRQGFPLDISMHRLFLGGGCIDGSFPFATDLQIDNGELSYFLPMPQNQAQTFLRSRTRWGSEDRTVQLALDVRPDLAPLSAASPRSQSALSASLIRFQIFSDNSHTQRLASVEESDIKALLADRQRLEAEKQAKAQAADREMQKGRLLSTANSMSKPARMANWLDDAPDLDWGRTLGTVREARLSAVLSTAPVAVTLLVQADGSGSNKVPTRWPGHLQLSSEESQEGFITGHWYLVSGSMTVPPSEGVTLGNAMLQVTHLYACLEAQCTETTDPIALVGRKIGLPSPSHH